MKDEKAKVSVGDKTLCVSRNLLGPAGFQSYTDDGVVWASPSNSMAMADVIAAVSMGMIDDEAFRWAIATANQRRHERTIMAAARATADTQLRTAQINLAIEREKRNER
jgi:hypothetical protein